MVRFRPEDYPDLSPDQIYDLIEERSLDEARLAHRKVDHAYQHFKKLRAEWKDALIAAGHEKSWAADEAEEEALKAVSKWYGLPKDTILRPDRKRRRRRPLKRA